MDEKLIEAPYKIGDLVKMKADRVEDLRNSYPWRHRPNSRGCQIFTEPAKIAYFSSEEYYYDKELKRGFNRPRQMTLSRWMSQGISLSYLTKAGTWSKHTLWMSMSDFYLIADSKSKESIAPLLDEAFEQFGAVIEKRNAKAAKKAEES